MSHCVCVVLTSIDLTGEGVLYGGVELYFSNSNQIINKDIEGAMLSPEKKELLVDLSDANAQ